MLQVRVSQRLSERPYIEVLSEGEVLGLLPVTRCEVVIDPGDVPIVKLSLPAQVTDTTTMETRN